MTCTSRPSLAALRHNACLPNGHPCCAAPLLVGGASHLLPAALSPPRPPAGALGYVPLCFVLPCVMWLKTQRGSLSVGQQVVNWAVIGVSLLVGLLAAVGSLRSLIVSFSSFEFFS